MVQGNDPAAATARIVACGVECAVMHGALPGRALHHAWHTVRVREMRVARSAMRAFVTINGCILRNTK